jgi:hypothetical protein
MALIWRHSRLWCWSRSPDGKGIPKGIRHQIRNMAQTILWHLIWRYCRHGASIIIMLSYGARHCNGAHMALGRIVWRLGAIQPCSAAQFLDRFGNRPSRQECPVTFLNLSHPRPKLVNEVVADGIPRALCSTVPSTWVAVAAQLARASSPRTLA